MNKSTTYNYPCLPQLQQYYSLVAAHADRWNISENRPADTEFSFTYAFLECWLSVQVICVLSQTNGNLTSRSICEIWATLSYQFWEAPSNFEPLNFDYYQRIIMVRVSTIYIGVLWTRVNVKFRRAVSVTSRRKCSSSCLTVRLDIELLPSVR